MLLPLGGHGDRSAKLFGGQKPGYDGRWLAVILRAATFNETRAPTSRKYVAEEDIVMSNWSKTFPTF